MKIALMTEAFIKFVDQATALKYIKELGFDAADVTLFEGATHYIPNKEMFCEDYLEYAKHIRNIADSLDLPLIQSHTCFPIYRPGDENYHQNMIEIQKKSIQICNILGIKNVVIHPWNRWTPEENKIFYQKLLPTAKENNVIICTENMFNWTVEEHHALLAACSSCENFLEHMEVVNDPNFGACVDVGHANMFSMVDKTINPQNMIKTLNKYVTCLHVHDNDGIEDNHDVPFSRSIDFVKVMKALKEINYQGDLVIEISVRYCDTLEQVIDKAKRSLEAGRKLIEIYNNL